VTPSQKEKLSALLQQPVGWDCSMKRYTSFSIGGVAEAVTKAENIYELQQLLSFLAAEIIPWRVIGRGTNLLVRDEGFPGVIVLLGSGFQIIGDKVSTADSSVILPVGGGCGLGRLSRHCMDQGLAGLEFTSGIPGSVGGAVLMNAGAWGGELSEVVRSVTLVTAETTIKLSGDDLSFTYRCWPGFVDYQGRGVIVEAEFELSTGDSTTIKEECKTLLDKRKQKQPLEYANAGSFFKNPHGDSAGRLIEASGLKGKAIGGAMVSEQHANFIVNRGEATATDILSLMKIIQEKVMKDSGVKLDSEVHFI